MLKLVIRFHFKVLVIDTDMSLRLMHRSFDVVGFEHKDWNR